MREEPFDDWVDQPRVARNVLPEGLEEMAPGPELAAVLAGIDRTELNGYELVVTMRAHARLVAHYQAGVYADAAELGHTPWGDRYTPPERTGVVDECAADEIRAGLYLTRRSADRLYGHALTLRERLPAVWEALTAGRIDDTRARVLADGVAHIANDDTARQIIDTILGDAGELTSGQLRARLRRECLTVDPDDAARRYRESRQERRVVLEADPDGTATLSGFGLAPDRATAISNRIDDLARQSGDGRSIDQRRADIYCQLLEGTHDQDGNAEGKSPNLDIRVDLDTLVGLNHLPAHIAGYGPILADIARQAALTHQDGEWKITVTDPDDGAILWNGTTRRRPTTRQRRYLETIHPPCVFPGCRQPARRSDIDHTIDRAHGGPTLVEYLRPLCRHDHTNKTIHGWHYTPTDHGHQWTSPRGHTYLTTSDPP